MFKDLKNQIVRRNCIKESAILLSKISNGTIIFILWLTKEACASDGISKH